ncbi:MAG: guanosine-3',5'-bis(diphosphate) 3'-pyrophosphohydrolase [Betaproteobacteria bacterium CG2_30_68_42]|nr:MAG: guanosine-3',5'-bis(diphosphate) 3'-pyrophosphohydrolase [Betaproteobacteria bacterium CG2_30_68_42]PJA58297.1 MAG: guanosine-3',5'-bis(diphosphate) 3'-pyrophosphohydrolase [Rhodocyclales bacterium CG_4_9_14_3_um_filter_68_10]
MEPAPAPPEPAAAPAADAAYEPVRKALATYLSPDDLEQIDTAYRFAAAAHAGQLRMSGEAYVTHPVAVTGILASWHLDPQALVAALLHDVTEDTPVGMEEIGTRFGAVAAELVDGVSKLDRIEFQSQEDAQAENFRKMLMAMSRDVRVILIKLADRLHNMRTLDAVPSEQRRRIARETLDIYAPIANRLGLNGVYRELQDLAFRHLYPLRYRVLAKAVQAARGNRRELVGKILEAIKRRLSELAIEAEVQGREKHLYSIYRKMREKSLSFSQVLDIYGFRVIVRDASSCYLTLGALHQLFRPVPGKFKDYIAIPKANGYRAVHTTLIGPYGTPVEIQIRTREMHQVAETGVASHWLYKDSGKSLSELQQMTHKWLQSLLDLQSASGDPHEFLDNVKIDLYPDEVYVFTPKGRILALPRGATAVDFAYAVHTDVGNRCIACRINRELMPLRTELRNGEQIEIITAAHANPNPAWLSYVKTGKARSEIRHYLKTMQYAESAALGERLLNRALQALGVNAGVIEPAAWDRLMRQGAAKSRQEVYTDIGLGKRLAAVVARRLVTREDEPRTLAPVVIRGSEGMAVQFATCCWPIPGDAIVGSIKKGQGLIVHLADCGAIRKSRAAKPENWIDVEWEPEPGRLFDAQIRVEAENHRGVLARVAAEIAAAGSNIQNVGMDAERGAYSSLYFTLQVSGRVHLARILRRIRRLPEVSRIGRTRE